MLWRTVQQTASFWASTLPCVFSCPSSPSSLVLKNVSPGEENLWLWHFLTLQPPHLEYLPRDIRHSATLSCFKSKLKTFFFSENLAKQHCPSPLISLYSVCVCERVCVMCTCVCMCVCILQFMYLVFTRMPGESYRRRIRSLLLYFCYVF